MMHEKYTHCWFEPAEWLLTNWPTERGLSGACASHVTSHDMCGPIRSRYAQDL